MKALRLAIQKVCIWTKETRDKHDKEGATLSVYNPIQTYQQNKAATASPGELTLMLYNGCLKFIKLAKIAIEQKNIQEKHTNIMKTQDIISELMVTLNMDMEISKSMLQMYDYMLDRLVEANLQNDSKILDEVEEYITQFRDTWKDVIQINRQKQFGNGTDHSG